MAQPMTFWQNIAFTVQYIPFYNFQKKKKIYGNRRLDLTVLNGLPLIGNKIVEPFSSKLIG